MEVLGNERYVLYYNYVHFRLQSQQSDHVHWQMRLGSAFGAFLDSVADNVSYGCIYIDLTVYKTFRGFCRPIPLLMMVPSTAIIASARGTETKYGSGLVQRFAEAAGKTPHSLPDIYLSQRSETKTARIRCESLSGLVEWSALAAAS
ncbi:hypothetical protein DY000_02034872 [Brassica cretica]|uniref:Uncharacterized protein n=1 Tax=Brassica cretica TaxID=69181 RepID=A0ABQ7DN59_BRACR|nr:hypothetical protein DY000_02034872 [Brassica cretica]